MSKIFNIETLDLCQSDNAAIFFSFLMKMLTVYSDALPVTARQKVSYRGALFLKFTPDLDTIRPLLTLMVTPLSVKVLKNRSN